MSRKLSLCVVALLMVGFALIGPNAYSRADENDPFEAGCCKQPAEQRAERARCCVPQLIGGTPASADARRRILEALRSSPTTVEFLEVPLRDVVGYLKDYHKIEVQIDTKALDDVGLTVDEPITKSLSGISLRSALKLTLRDLDLTYVIQDEVLLITTPEEAENRFITMLYPVSELLAEGDRQGHFAADGKTLITAIVSTVQPTTWDEVGGPGSITGVSFRGVDALLVSQTEEVHEEIAELLRVLCRMAKVTE